MANIIRQPEVEGPVIPDLIKTDFGAKVAASALQGQQEEKAHKDVHHHLPKGVDHDHHTKNMVEMREDETRQIIGLSGGSITGGQLKSNKDKMAKPGEGSEVTDPWRDPNRVSEDDDIQTALKKLADRAQSDPSTQITGDEPVVTLEEIDGLNGIAQNIRDFGNYGYLSKSPELVILMTGGYSESIDNLLASKGIEIQDPTQMSNGELALIFQLLQTKRKKVLSEEEKEAELILNGAIAVLAIPEILKKLEELGIDPSKVKSLEGQLAQILKEASQEGSQYHSLYLLVKEEAELSILPPEDEMDAAA